MAIKAFQAIFCAKVFVIELLKFLEQLFVLRLCEALKKIEPAKSSETTHDPEILTQKSTFSS
ncbi:hypothetical protein JHK84_044965 [Glycine max]|nr:hypothetical protein JHK84_044965 [Glycine max]